MIRGDWVAVHSINHGVNQPASSSSQQQSASTSASASSRPATVRVASVPCRTTRDQLAINRAKAQVQAAVRLREAKDNQQRATVALQAVQQLASSEAAPNKGEGHKTSLTLVCPTSLTTPLLRSLRSWRV